MPRSVLTLVVVAALGLGGLQALAAGGVMTQADVLGVSSMLSSGGGSVSETASEQGQQHKKDKAKDEQEATTESQEQDDEDESTATAAQTEQQQEEEGACTANSESHGCAVSKAVHEAQEATPPGRDRGVAVSTAARTADCSMLPQGAQAACAKRAEKEHPHANTTTTTQSSTGKGKGKK